MKKLFLVLSLIFVGCDSKTAPAPTSVISKTPIAVVFNEERFKIVSIQKDGQEESYAFESYVFKDKKNGKEFLVVMHSGGVAISPLSSVTAEVTEVLK